MEELKKLNDQIASLFEEFKTEADKHVNKGNNAAGARARKLSGELGKLLKSFRAESNAAVKAAKEAKKAE